MYVCMYVCKLPAYICLCIHVCAHSGHNRPLLEQGGGTNLEILISSSSAQEASRAHRCAEYCACAVRLKCPGVGRERCVCVSNHCDVALLGMIVGSGGGSFGGIPRKRRARDHEGVLKGGGGSPVLDASRVSTWQPGCTFSSRRRCTTCPLNIPSRVPEGLERRCSTRPHPSCP
jgi:hypothetical protein